MQPDNLKHPSPQEVEMQRFHKQGQPLFFDKTCEKGKNHRKRIKKREKKRGEEEGHSKTELAY